MEVLQAFGTGPQRERWLTPLAPGEVRSCFAMTEPDFPGSEPGLVGDDGRPRRATPTC